MTLTTYLKAFLCRMSLVSVRLGTAQVGHIVLVSNLLILPSTKLVQTYQA